MTREEAKQWLEAMKSAYALPIETYEAIDMAIEALSADAEPKWNCTANFVAEQLDRLRNMTDEEKWEFFSKFFSQSADAVQTDLVQRSDVLEVISDAQDGSGSTYNILQPIFVKVNNLPSCHRCYECDEQFYQQLLENGMIELPQEYVSVVRCKDCRYWEYEKPKGACIRHTEDTLGYAISTGWDDFCSWGERREPENE